MTELDVKALDAAAIALSGAPFPTRNSLARATRTITAYLAALAALDGAGRDAVIEEIAKWLEEQAEADFAVAEDMPEYSPDGYRLMLRRKWRKADAAAIRALKETR